MVRLKSFFRAVVLTVLAWGFLSPIHVLAQAYGPAVPETGEVDGNGVHLPTGRPIVVKGGSLSIGPAGTGGLGITPQYYSGWRFQEIPAIMGDTTNPVVTFMGVSTSFVLENGQYRANFPNGATLNATLTEFIAPDGTKISFYNPAYSLGDPQSWGNMLGGYIVYPTQIMFPNGIIRTFNYQISQYSDYTIGGRYIGETDAVRLSSITNNLGYQIKFYYFSDVPAKPASSYNRVKYFKAINNAVEYCAPVSSDCTLSNPWPTLTVATSYPVSSNAPITDQFGDSTAFSGAGFTRPGATTPTTSYTYVNSKVATATIAGVVSTYSYSGSTTTVTTPGAATVSITYNAQGRTISRTVAGQTSTFTYCTVNDSTCRIGQLRTATTPEGQVTTYSYNDRGLVTQTTSAATAGSGLAAITTSATYAATCANPVTCNAPASTTDTAGNVTNYTYDPNHGGVTQIQLPPAAAEQPRPTVNVTYASYFAQAKNASGTLVPFATAITMPTGSTRCRTAATCAGTVNEQLSQIAYSNATQPNLLPVSVTSRLGNNTAISTTAYTYNNLGQVLTVDGPEAGTADTIYNRYEANGRPVGSISADPDGAGPLPRVAQRMTYSFGLAVTQETGTVAGVTDTDWTNFTVDQRADTIYDQYGRPAVQRHRAPGSGTTQYSVSQTSYDSAGRVACTVQRMNAPLTTTVLPGAPTANLATTTNAGSVCSVMTAGSNGPDRITQNTYDNNGRLTSVQSGVGTGLVQATQSFGYRSAANQNGQLAWVKDAENNQTDYAYDAFGRRHRTSYPDPLFDNMASTTDYDQVSFDSFGRINGFRTRRNETLTFAYDNLGRVTSVVVPERAGLAATHTRDVYYGYDLFSNMEYARFDSATGEGITNTWNALSQLVATTNNMDGTGRTLAYSYDEVGRFSTLTHPDAQAFTYLYDVMNRPTTLRNLSGEDLVTWSYSTQGRRSSQSANGPAADTLYGFDAAGRLETLTLDHTTASYDNQYSFTYNPAGQITSQTQSNNSFAFNAYTSSNIGYVANNLNQYTSRDAGAGPMAVSYDASGNLTSDGSTNYVYDAENRMVSSNSAAGTVTLRYDPLGRLYEIQAATGQIRRNYYSGQDLVLEYDGATNAMFARYVHGLSEGDDPLVAFNGSAPATTLPYAFFFAQDARGSIVLFNRTGSLLPVIISYDEYGVPSNTPSSRFRYTGQVWVPEVGLLYYKARMYSPTLGRFMQTDPIGYGDGMNMYAYVGGDPINFVDFTGMDTDPSFAGLDACVIDCNAVAESDGEGTIVVTGERPLACATGWVCTRPSSAWGRMVSTFVIPRASSRTTGLTLGSRETDKPPTSDNCKTSAGTASVGSAINATGYAASSMNGIVAGGIGSLPGPVGRVADGFQLAGSVANLGASAQRGEALDVSIARVALPLAGTIIGEQVALRISVTVGLANPLAGVATGAVLLPSFAFAGDSIGTWAANEYADLRGEVGCQ